jgi:formylglycine-generating enzyme required for sulfatase activity
MKYLLFLFTALLLFFAVCFVSCKKPKVAEVRLNRTELRLIVGDAETLIATILPEDVDNKAVSWRSDNLTVATVDNSGKVTAITVGTATITVTSVDGNKTARCTVIVTQAEEPFEEPEMIFVEGGTFLFGCTDGECGGINENTIEQLAVEVTVKSFYIAKYPVTQKLWKAVMGSLPERLIGGDYGVGDNYPVYYVNCANDMCDFINKLRLMTGKNYSLPSTEEWEYAARGGAKNQNYKYSGSNNIDEVAWYNGNSNNSSHPVGEKLPNELGIYDMSGNVWEWTSSEWWWPEPGSKWESKMPVDMEIRGGASYNSMHSCRVSTRTTRGDRYRYYDTGFRLTLIVSE